MKRGLFIFLLILPIITAQPIVWIEDGMQRIQPDDSQGLGTSITISAAKGEWEPFQIIVRGPTGGLTNVDVSAPDLTGTGTISSDNIMLYREHFLTTSGSSNWGGSNQPEGPGTYPEPLIPFVDPETHQELSGFLDARPFSVSANKNQPIWVDVYVPRDTQAGTYLGTFTVSSNQGNVDVSLTLNVWDFEMPDLIGIPFITQLWNAPQSTATYNEMLRHKIQPYSVNDERYYIDNYGLTHISGGFWSGAEQGNCNPGSPPSVSSIQTERDRHESDLVVYAHYADEVTGCGSSFTQNAVGWAQNLRAGGIAPLLPSGITEEFLGNSHEQSVADIWVILPVQGDSSGVQTAIARTDEEVWSYNALIQDEYSPKWTLDFAPINFRIHPGFMSASTGMTGAEYWVMDYWSGDVWNEVGGFESSSPQDGIFVYPGSGVALNGVCAGMRMKWLREGIDDYEYWKILTDLGDADYAMQQAQSVGRAWDDWTRDTDEIYQVRENIANKIIELQGGAPPGGNLCTENNWQYADSICGPDRTLTRTWVKTGSCDGGVTHPASEKVSCACAHDADVDCDGCIDTPELSDYINLWKTGHIEISDLMSAINIWKAGC